MNELIPLALVIFALAELIKEGTAQDFGYEGTAGPEHWGDTFGKCVGKHQSPINIQDHDVEIVDLLPMVYENFEENAEFSVTNNGHTVQFQLNAPKIPMISGGPLIGKYVFAQFHFHWGENDDEGSESQINNSSFPMELHLVFYSRAYGSMEAATEHPDGLCVIAFLYSKTEQFNDRYTEIINILPEVKKVGSMAKVNQPVPLDYFLPTNRSHYYTYGGSLTTPPCSEVVTWIEFKHTISISHEQVDMFRQLSSEHGKLIHNFRPPQNLHGRVIRTNRDIECACKGSQNSKNVFILTISAAVLYFSVV